MQQDVGYISKQLFNASSVAKSPRLIDRLYTVLLQQNNMVRKQRTNVYPRYQWREKHIRLW